MKKECVFTKFADYSTDEKKGELRSCWGDRPGFEEFWEKWLDGMEYKTQRDEKAKRDRKRRVEAKLNPENRHHKFYRISLPDDIDKVKINMWKLSNLKYLRDDLAFCLEYHSENFPDGGNLHIHLITHTRTKDSKLLTDFARVFKVDKPKVESCDYRPDLYHTRGGYIRGDKEEHKDEFIEKDKRWRHENELQDYYNFNFFQ